MKIGLDVVTKSMLKKKLGKLPSIIEKTNFIEGCLVEQGGKILVPAYVGSQMGFSHRGKQILDDFYSKLEDINVFPLCPFKACGEYLDLSKLNNKMPVEELKQFWDRYNRLIGTVNYEVLAPYAKFMIALFDGGHAVDDGLCAEVAYFAAAEYKPVIGIRSDFRLAENIATTVNPAVRYFIDLSDYGGKFFDGDNAEEDALHEIEDLAKRIIADNSRR
jgi:hypothetical protein